MRTAAITAQLHPYLPLFVTPERCDRCFGIGLRMAPTGGIEQCPSIQLGDPHCDLTPSGKRIVRAVEVLRRRTLEPDVIHFEIARTLAVHSAAAPCPTHELVSRHFAYVDGVENQRRKVTMAVRFLREIWSLPIASSKREPSGYWISTDLADFKAYYERAQAEPKTTLSTLHRMAKANWPEYAEQIELEFWADFNTEEAAACQ